VVSADAIAKLKVFGVLAEQFHPQADHEELPDFFFE
jgi:hypothetical protein